MEEQAAAAQERARRDAHHSERANAEQLLLVRANTAQEYADAAQVNADAQREYATANANARTALLSMMNDSREQEARRIEHEALHQAAQRRLFEHETLHQEAQRLRIEHEALPYGGIKRVLFLL